MDLNTSLWDVTEGLGVAVSLQSFAARALLGSVVAVVLATVAVRFGWVRSSRARRTLILAPIIAALAAVAACTAPGSTFLPALVVSSAGGQPFEIFGEGFTVRRLEWLLVGYIAVATFLLLRRAVGHWAIHRYVACARRSTAPEPSAIVRRIATKLGIAAPPLLLVDRCPGGAFTAGARHPVVAIDPVLLDELDRGEFEGLVAHELAHIARRDVLANSVIGIIRDLTFFIPPLTLAGRWLRLDQEHAADDLASEATRRPAALASSILKVWEGSQGNGRRQYAAMACATMVPAGALASADGAMPSSIASRGLRWPGAAGGARQIAERVVRLIQRGAPLSRRRQRVELVLAMTAVMIATAVTVVLPAQVHGELLLAQWKRPPVQPVESPALDTFRVLAVDAQPLMATATGVVAPDTSQAQACRECLTMESAAEWRAQTLPALPPRASGWQAGGRIWEEAAEGGPTPLSAQALWGVDLSPAASATAGSRVGIFLVR